ncbi:MAG: zinc carboxypeptidase, partial [bacterium]|nr:zinc carboxypeptidase [bacterium]
MRLRGLIVVFATLIITVGYVAAEEQAFVKVFAKGWPAINGLVSEGFGVDTCKAPDDDGVFVYADSAERARLADYGYQYEVIHAIANHPIEDPVITEPYMGGKATYDHYFNYVEMENLLTQTRDTLNGKVANTAQLIDIGDSVEGRDLIGIKISDNVNTEEMEPEVRLLGTHHGNEMISYMALLYFLEQLADNFDNPDTNDWTKLVNGCELWVVPVVNPDGVNAGFYHYEEADGYRTSNGSRYNANYADLNRNYDYMWDGSCGTSGAFSQPETAAVRDNHELNHYVISHSYHSGAYYINYVWNYVDEGSPDNHTPP